MYDKQTDFDAGGRDTADDGDDLVFPTNPGTPYPYIQYDGGAAGGVDDKSVRGGGGSSARPKSGKKSSSTRDKDKGAWIAEQIA